MSPPNRSPLPPTSGVRLLYVKPVGPGVVDLFVRDMAGPSPGTVANVTNMAAEQLDCQRWRVR